MKKLLIIFVKENLINNKSVPAFFMFLFFMTVDTVFPQTALDLSIEQALQQVTEAYSAENANIDTYERTSAWKTVIDILAEDKENKTKISDFLNQLMSERLGLRVTAVNTDIPMLINFLKTFSKTEAVHILHLWIQANTDPDIVNGLYTPPEIFIRERVGDCTEVSWLTEIILKELDIEAAVFIAEYNIYAFKIFIRGHAFTGMDFTENGEAKRYIIDNEYLYNLSPQETWKNIIWNLYSKNLEVWGYREINTTRWRNVRKDTEDPYRVLQSLKVYSLIPQEIAIREFAGYDLSLFFDDPTLETLFFRDDFRQTINSQKQAKEIASTEHTRLMNLWYEYENIGIKKK